MRRSVVALSLAAASAFAAQPAAVRAAADTPYALFVDGRPVDARTPSGLLHRGVVFVNVVRAVKTFDGLLTFAGDGRTRVTIGGTTIDFRVGSPVGFSGTTRVRLPGAPFVENGDTYVPLATVASLAGAKLHVDGVHRRALLTSSPIPAFTPTPVPTSASDDLVPSPAQALKITLGARSDAAGLHARADIANRTSRPYALAFPSDRQVEFVVARNGSEIWSSVDAATPAGPPSVLVVPARGTSAVAADWSGYAKAGPGRYTLRVRLLTATPLDQPPLSLDAPQAGPPG